MSSCIYTKGTPKDHSIRPSQLNFRNTNMSISFSSHHSLKSMEKTLDVHWCNWMLHQESCTNYLRSAKQITTATLTAIGSCWLMEALKPLTSRSPNLNQILYLWDIMHHCIQCHQGLAQTVQEFPDALVQVWEEIPQDIVCRLMLLVVHTGMCGPCTLLSRIMSQIAFFRVVFNTAIYGFHLLVCYCFVILFRSNYTVCSVTGDVKVNGKAGIKET